MARRWRRKRNKRRIETAIKIILSLLFLSPSIVGIVDNFIINLLYSFKLCGRRSFSSASSAAASTLPFIVSSSYRLQFLPIHRWSSSSLPSPLSSTTYNIPSHFWFIKSAGAVVSHRRRSAEFCPHID